jgi:hypothetical protein
MLISVTLYAIVWMGRFHPLGETWNSTQLTRNAHRPGVLEAAFERLSKKPNTLTLLRKKYSKIYLK